MSTDTPTLADIAGIPRTGFTEFDGKTYPLRQPTLPEEGLFSRWLEANAYASIARQTRLPESERRQHRKEVREDAAAGEFEFHGYTCTKALATVEGQAKIWSITLQADGFEECDLEYCKRMVRANLEQTALEMMKAAEADPKVKAALGAILGAVMKMTTRPGNPTPGSAGTSSPPSGTPSTGS